jgi:oxaloacetate decarboxylase alpha subunit
MSDRIDFEQVREVVRLAEELGVAELEVETAALKVRVKMAGAGQAQTGTGAAQAGALTPAATPASVSAVAEVAGTDHLEAVVAPMVGTFYRAPSPDAPPFVKEGDFVEENQVVCVIEAMKLFNEIQAEKRGRIARVLTENATPVEFGQPLFLVDTLASRG